MFCALSTATAIAEESSGFYIGGDFAGIDAASGRSRGLLVGTPGGVITVLPESATVTGTDIGWAIQGGFRINEYLAVEAGFTDFGSMVVDQTYDLSIIGISELEYPWDFEASGFSLSWLANIALGKRINVFVRVGALHANQEVTSRLRAVLPGESAVEKASETIPMLGAGLSYRAAENWFLRVEYQYLDGLNGGETPNVASLGPIRLQRIGLGIACEF